MQDGHHALNGLWRALPLLAALSAAGCAEQGAGGTVRQAVFAEAFTPGFETTDTEGNRLRFAVHYAGHLALPSGSLVICEPLYFHDQEPLKEKLPPGRYRVELAEATIYRGGKAVDRRNAFARIILAPGTAVEWREAGAFGADGGTGGYIDGKAMQALIDAGRAEAFSNELLEAFEPVYAAAERFETDPDGYHQYVELPVGEANLIAFSTGWGDGWYASYLGLDNSGAVVEVLTDLGVVHWSPQ